MIQYTQSFGPVLGTDYGFQQTFAKCKIHREFCAKLQDTEDKF